LKEFSVYSNSNGKLRAVKNGWCWPAFFFGSLWSLFSGFLVAALFMIPIEFLLNFAVGVVNDEQRRHGPDDVTRIIGGGIALTFIIIRLIYGAQGNKWHKARCLKGGFEFRGTVGAATKADAVKSYIAK
jgi:Protein of unknown function (DUF2628).